VSYSHAGEDLIVNALFRSFGIKQIKYLDVGANHPDYMSNTYLFYKTGSCGVTVEPNPELYAKHRKMRPDDRCINAGIGFDDRTMGVFYLFSGSEDGRSTFSKEEAERFEKTDVAASGRFNIKHIMKMPLKQINAIIEETGVPDFLSIDIGVLGLNVLRTLDFSKYRVKCVCAETIHYDEISECIREKELFKFLTDVGYIVYADTGTSTIFVDNSWFSNLVDQL
jgi:FkbM family methyltransferase